MAILTEAQRDAVWADFQRQRSEARAPIAVNKTQGRAVVGAVDDWVETVLASFNAAIPSAARAALSAREKAELLYKVMRARFQAS